MNAEYNLFGAQAFVAELLRAQLEHVVVCPGSRSTPLALALYREKRLRSHILLDERAAGFFALGLAKATGRPVALLCTSGSAGAHFFPAITEAFFSRVPLLVVTADRPWELHGFGAPQTMPQLGLYGKFVCLSENIPAPNGDREVLLHMRAVVAKALASAKHKALPAHLNFEFREPLSSALAWEKWLPEALSTLPHPPSFVYAEGEGAPRELEPVLSALNSALRPLVVVGNTPSNPRFASAVYKLSQKLAAPLLAEAASNLRFQTPADVPMIASYDILLRDDGLRKRMKADVVLCLGGTLVSKHLQAWLKDSGARLFMLLEHGVEADFQHIAEAVVQCNVVEACRFFEEHISDKDKTYAGQWVRLEERAQQTLSELLKEDGCEPAIARKLMASIPPGSNCFIANSMPIRDIDAFSAPSSKEVCVYVNRGLNGIDGLVSTAQGVAVASQRPTVLLIGDLAFLHDMSGWLLTKRLDIPLIVVVVNNRGGGIFHFLPVAEQRDEFEACFALPHDTSFAKIAEVVGAHYANPKTLPEFSSALSAAWQQKLSLIEICTDRHSNLNTHQKLYEGVLKALKGLV
ncbi:MAG: 2-succinyl-5-enolpyruvyl-6-hydroxy-3-cyclohexene-1-carboxylic-acid synthase [Proteobacteria bacterium]|nr:2-succinyl-5-enolpyruvyl-6-hydroxy-3-cyclohexene-1-carboxylic-acid synthase [Cystobacterineae bacterium]MCL2258931.1 2-succinyl-5-enolpyruvyl-6-hydroxy-3-cyclohexene-1-carboxylic-acid synthase [Cystobacterineae bacterium]MCL2314757.1 2-succinyl-5-enolpyruvyl-6-hydroxy-3-cyclohexene-1-carboxylic-acid synthase [Pseudomonadota bacterium]